MSRSRSVATMVGRRLAPKVAGAAPGLTETFVREALDRAAQMPTELGGRDGPEPVRYGDWEKQGLAIDF